MEGSRHKMADKFEGAWRKLERANEHMGNLQRETDAYMGVKTGDIPYGSRSELHIATGFWTLHLAVKRPIDPRWGLIAGDIASNLRAVLDHLVYELAGPKATFETEFPIHTNKDTYLKARKDRSGKERPSRRDAALDGVPAEFRAIVDSKQPWLAGEKAADHPLAVLAAFNNADKHRSVHPALARLSQDPKLVALDGKTYTPAYARKGQRLDNGDPMCTFRLPGWVPGMEPNVNVRLDMTLEIAFGERPVGDVELGQIGQYIADIFNEFVTLARSQPVTP